MFKKTAGCIVSVLALITSLAAVHQQRGTNNPAVRTFGDVQARRAELDAKIIALNKEEDEANAAAMKIQADHPTKFKSKLK